jgi:predicted metal-dependent phosphoesterase TrpH
MFFTSPTTKTSPVTRDDAPSSTSRYAATLHRLRALPLGLLAIVVLVLLSALFPVAPVHDAATFESITEVTLQRPLSYVLMAPVSDVLDTLTLLSLRQHIALLATVIVVYLVWWVCVGRDALRTVTPGRRALREAARIGVGVVVFVAVYAAVAVMPRPMAALEPNPSLLAVDFHSHTRFSHDGRPDWTPEDVRAWHRDAGFNVAYVTDHRTFDGAREAWANNPALAGEGISLLPGIEVVWKGEHVNVLDADRLYHGLLTPTLRDVDDASLTLASTLVGNEPLLIETIPGDLSKIVAASGPGTPGVRAIEVVDGAPLGLGQSRRERARILRLSDSLNLALVAGSDHHGWGHTASAWTLIFVPQWRSATPSQLSNGIANILRRGGKDATRVAERYVADTERPLALPFTVPLVAWGMLRSMSADERVAWMVWIVVIYAFWRVSRARRRAQRRTPAADV